MDWKEIVGLVAGSSTVTGGFFVLLNRVVPTPTHRLNMVKMGNEFVEDLLAQARLEREELRSTIRTLEEANGKADRELAELKILIAQKDVQIDELQRRQRQVAHKISLGLTITDIDVFGFKQTRGELT